MSKNDIYLITLNEREKATIYAALSWWFNFLTGNNKMDDEVLNLFYWLRATNYGTTNAMNASEANALIEKINNWKPL